MATYGHAGGYAFNEDQRDAMRNRQLFDVLKVNPDNSMSLIQQVWAIDQSEAIVHVRNQHWRTLNGAQLIAAKPGE